MDVELLPCPFCGGRAKVMRMDYLNEMQTVWGVFCERDLDAECAHGHYIDNYATKQEAIDAWNRRAQ